MTLKEKTELTNEQIIEKLYFLNKKLNEDFNAITLNSYAYLKEEIEVTRDSIINFVNDNGKTVCEKITSIIKSLELNKRNDLIKNIKEIDINLKKFFAKSYSKFVPNNKQIINYWRNEYLNAYKEHFFKTKATSNAIFYDKQQSLLTQKQFKPNEFLDSSTKIDKEIQEQELLMAVE